MAEGDEEKDKPVELQYAQPHSHRSFQDALTDFVKQETANGNLRRSSRVQMFLETVVTLGAIAGLFVALSWFLYRFHR